MTKYEKLSEQERIELKEKINKLIDKLAAKKNSPDSHMWWKQSLVNPVKKPLYDDAYFDAIENWSDWTE